jgi:hypothetical protein
MPDNPQSRRLTMIVALDVAGYSARTEADEARTTAEVAALRRVIEGIATAKGGRVFSARRASYCSNPVIEPSHFDDPRASP